MGTRKSLRQPTQPSDTIHRTNHKSSHYDSVNDNVTSWGSPHPRVEEDTCLKRNKKKQKRGQDCRDIFSELRGAFASGWSLLATRGLPLPFVFVTVLNDKVFATSSVCDRFDERLAPARLIASTCYSVCASGTKSEPSPSSSDFESALGGVGSCCCPFFQYIAP